MIYKTAKCLRYVLEAVPSENWDSNFLLQLEQKISSLLESCFFGQTSDNSITKIAGKTDQSRI